MENDETLNNKKQDSDVPIKNYLKITDVRVFSRAYNLRLKENDIIIALNGEYFNSTYEELKKILEENDENKIVTILRDETYFNITANSSLGIKCEEIQENHIKNLPNTDLKDIIDTDKHYKQYEVYKNFKRNGVLLNLELSLLASIAPPLWMIYHRCWTIFGFTIVFLIMMFSVSPWLFCISWVLKSWYYGLNQTNVLRNYLNFKNYKLFLVLTCTNEEEGQKICRSLDSKIDFDYSYLEPPVKDEDSLEAS